MTEQAGKHGEWIPFWASRPGQTWVELALCFPLGWRKSVSYWAALGVGVWEAWVQILALPNLGLDSAEGSCLDKQPASSSRGKPGCRRGSEVCCWSGRARLWVWSTCRQLCPSMSRAPQETGFRTQASPPTHLLQIRKPQPALPSHIGASGDPGPLQNYKLPDPERFRGSQLGITVDPRGRSWGSTCSLRNTPLLVFLSWGPCKGLFNLW